MPRKSKVLKLTPIASGNFDGSDETTEEALLEEAGYMLDACESHEICGVNLWKGSDGKYYVITVEAIFTEAHPDFVKDMLEDMPEE